MTMMVSAVEHAGIADPVEDRQPKHPPGVLATPAPKLVLATPAPKLWLA